GLHPAFTDAGQADEILFAMKPLCHQRAHSYRNHRAEMTDHRELTVGRFSAMNVAVAPAHWPLSRAEISARNIEDRLSKRGAPGLIANQRRKNVAFLQKQSASDADRFLAFTDINPAGDLAAAIKADQFLLECAREQHPAKRLEESLMRRRFLSRRFFSALRRLKHRPILRRIDNRAQKKFKVDRALRHSMLPIMRLRRDFSIARGAADSPITLSQRFAFSRRARFRQGRIGVVKKPVRVEAALARLREARSTSFRPACSRRVLPSSRRKARPPSRSCVYCG